MKLKTLNGKFIRYNYEGVAKIWFVTNIYKQDYQVIIDYMQVATTTTGVKLFSSSHEMSYSEFQRDGISDSYAKNKFDMDFSQVDMMIDFIRVLMHK